MTHDDSVAADELLAVVAAAWEAGSPIAGRHPADQERVADVARRRWRSYERRHRRRNAFDRESRIDDLAKGLRDQLEHEPQLAGPLIEDYRWLARELADVLDPEG